MYLIAEIRILDQNTQASNRLTDLAHEFGRLFIWERSPGQNQVGRIGRRFQECLVEWDLATSRVVDS